MNALARIVRNLTVGRERTQSDLGALSPQELSALQAIKASVTLSPQEVGRVLASIGPQEAWLSPTRTPKRAAC